MMDDFDPKAAALLILKKHKGKAADETASDDEDDELALADIMRAMHKAMSAGDFEKAADIFKTALETCSE